MVWTTGKNKWNQVCSQSSNLNSLKHVAAVQSETETKSYMWKWIWNVTCESETETPYSRQVVDDSTHIKSQCSKTNNKPQQQKGLQVKVFCTISKSSATFVGTAN